MAQPPFSLSSPVALVIAVLLALLAVSIVWLRRLKLPPAWLGAIGLNLLCLACGGPLWNRPIPGDVAVMVDLSPSTRGAYFRNRAALESRIRELLGRQRFHILAFSSGTPTALPDGNILPDIPADRTALLPPTGAAAVVLFSDARFEPPQFAPAIYPVVDPGLEEPRDARIASLEIRSGQAHIDASNLGQPRLLSLYGIQGAPTSSVPQGAYAIARPLLPDAPRASAQLSPGDLWPENDQLAAVPPPPDVAQRWWIGSSNAPSGWRTLAPNSLPTDPTAYLSASVIVLQNIPASDLSDLQQQRLSQYVRDLGGTLLILGGDRAFASGGYPGSQLETLSPLSSTPPQPVNRWMLLVDGSGSMATAQGSASRWQIAGDALAHVIPHLPPDDLVDVGSFAENLNWWSSGVSARQTAQKTLPPANAFPHGPTNLQAALNAIAQNADGTMPRPLLLLTDSDVQIDDPAALAASLRQKNIHLFLLAIGQGSGLPALQILTSATGGAVIQQLDPGKWAAGILQLMRAASPRLLATNPIDVRLDDPQHPITLTGISPWNRTWLKAPATVLATGKTEQENPTLGASWNVGEGRAAALAFDAPANAIEPLLQAFERPPHDPRLSISWEPTSQLKLAVRAADGPKYLNGLNLSLDISSALDAAQPPSSSAIPQTAPGEYALAADAPRAASFAAVRLDGRVIDRIAVAGRYPPEFDEVGNDHAAMERLAHLTGGRLIAPDQHTPIDFRFPARQIDVTSIIAILGAAFLGLALARWNFG